MDQNRPTAQEGFIKRVALATCTVISISLLLVLAYYAIYVLLLTFSGILLAIVISAASSRLSKYLRLSELWSVAIVIATMCVVLIGIGFIAAPQIAQQFDELRQTIPESIEKVEDWLTKRPWGERVLETVGEMDTIEDAQIGQFFLRLTGIAYGALNVVIGVAIVGFIALYLSINPMLYVNGFLRLLPFSYRSRAAQILGAAGYTLKWWLLASLTKMAAVGIMTFVGLVFLDIPLAFLLSILAFLLDFIPYFGPILAAIPAVLIAFVEGPTQVLWVIVLYTIVQQIESLFIAPILFHRIVYMPPVITVVAQILLAILAGPLGIILATPLIAVALILVKMMYIEDVIGDSLDIKFTPIESHLIKQPASSKIDIT